MEFAQLLNAIEDEPVFETGLLLAGDVDPFDVRRQLSRWTTSGKIYQLRRGLYTLAPPYQKVIPHPYQVANRLQPGSYISLQSALDYYGMIPESVPTVTSVTTSRPLTVNTPLGSFAFRHIQVNWFHGYSQVALGGNQRAFIASPEKALLDLVYLQTGGDLYAYLNSLRLQAMDQLAPEKLQGLAEMSQKPKLLRAVEVILSLAREEVEGYHTV